MNRITKYRKGKTPRVGTELRRVVLGHKSILFLTEKGCLHETLTPKDPKFDFFYTEAP